MARRSSSTLLWVLLGVGLLGGALFALLEMGDVERSPHGADPLAAARGVTDASPAADRGLLPEPRIVVGEKGDPAATTVLWPVLVELELLEPGYLPKEPGMTPVGSGATARLTGHILAPGRGVRSEDQGAEAEIRFRAGPNEGRILRTDAAGKFGASDLYPGLDVVDVVGNGLIGARREVRLRQGKETLLNIPFGRPGALQGRVQDSDGAGIEGADINVDGRSVVSGLEGEFYAGPVAAGQVLVQVSHPDFASYQELVWVASGQVAPSGTVNFTLEPAAVLKIAIQGNVGGPGPVQVYLLPAQPSRRVRSESIYRNVRAPFHELNPIEIWPGIPKVIPGLPAETLQVHAFRPGAEAPSKTVHLRRDRPVELELRMQPAKMLTGRVLEDGEPVAGAEVVLEAPNRVRAMLAYLREGSHILESSVMPSFPPARQVAKSDSAGRFNFTAYEELSPVRYLEARGASGTKWAGRLVHRGDREFELELEEAELANSELHVDFKGRSQGLPVEIWIDGAPSETRVVPRGEDLILEPLLAGRWHLKVSWRGEPIVDEVLRLSGRWSEGYDLPSACIEGQDEETWRRAGREFPR